MSYLKVCFSPYCSLNEMITVYASRNSTGRESSAHELQTNNQLHVYEICYIEIYKGNPHIAIL